ncbi:MAG: hypothetical protein WCO66_00285 [Candidatus Absconditabacteria bacterium]
MDSLGSFRSVGTNTRPLSKKEIDRMKKIMRRVPVLKQQNDEYHKKEEQEADDFFSKKLDEIN